MDPRNYAVLVKKKDKLAKDIAQKCDGPIHHLWMWLMLLVDVHLAFNGASSN